MGAKVIGSGYYAPSSVVTNDDLSKIVDTSDAWIYERTGIKQRYISTDETTSDLAYKASLKAIKDAKIDKEEIEVIIVATMTPDNFTPSVACLVQERLGLNKQHVVAFDLNAACSGFVYALSVANSMLTSYKTILVIGAETMSNLIDWNDRNTCVLFGDGAGAMIIKRDEQKHMDFYLQSIGDVSGALEAKGISKQAPNQMQEKTYDFLKMNGAEVFRFAVKAMQKGIEEILIQTNKRLEDIDIIVPHQANARIVSHVQKKMKTKDDMFFMNVNEFGNTSAASVAIAFAQAKQQGKIVEGNNIILVAFGAGFTYAAAYIEM